MSEIRNIPLASLKVHPINIELHGDDPKVDDLLMSIPEMGLLDPLEITSDNLIVDGRRRFKALGLLSWESVDCEVREDLTNGDEIFLYIMSKDQQKEKTARYIYYASKRLMEIEAEKAKQRMSMGGKGKPISADLTGQSRDIVAQFFNIGRSKLAQIWDIYDNEEIYSDVISELDNGNHSINWTYNKIRGIQRKDDRLQEKKALFFRIIAGVRRTSLREELLDQFNNDERVRTTTEKDLRKEIFIRLGTPVGETFLEVWRETKSNVSDAADEIALSDEHYRMSVWNDGPRNFVQLIIWMDESEGAKPLRRDTLLEHNFTSFKAADDHARQYGGYCQGLYNYAGRNYWVLWVKEELLPKEEDEDENTTN